MKFIEMSGATLRKIISTEEMREDDLQNSGVGEGTIVRVNEHGDIEVRRAASWDVVGGLLGDFEVRVKNSTGLDWA